MSKMTDTTRRALLKTMAAIPVASATPLALQLLCMSNAAAQTATDYKALVCVFLFGGNDHYNTVIPYDTTNYNLYRTIRGGENWADYPTYSGIAIKNRDLLNNTALSSTTGLASGLQMALDPNMTGMKALFDAGRVGIVLNSGPLVRPTTLAQYNNKSVPLPPKLFSHNDQQAYTQSANLTEGAASGWGGRAADLILSQNTNSALTCISLTGNVVYLAGSQAISYQVSSSFGPMTVNAIKNNSLYQSNTARNALNTLVTQTRTHVLENEYRNIMQRGLNTHGTLESAIGSTPAASSTLTNFFSSANTNTLSAQLRMVARVLAQRDTLGLKRQVFIVGMGGFDNHDFLPRNHGGLLQKVSAAFSEFDGALGHLGLRDSVTTFTASDFGRTLANNGDGSDHGWGGHYFVMGGKVNGNRFFGTAPEIGLTHSQQVGSGRLLPSTANDQVSAELARWFGVSDTNMSTVLPNSGNFTLHQLGLMNPT